MGGEAGPAGSEQITIEVINSLAKVREFRQAHAGHSLLQGDRGQDLHWLEAVCSGLRHEPKLIVARRSDEVVGLLPLAFVKSRIFGRFLVSLPYVNSAGVNADDEWAARELIDRAVELADELNVRHLELRHEQPIEHAALSETLTSKVHMRLPLPGSPEELWKSFRPKVRNQIRKGEKQGLSVRWGREQLLPEFYAVFARNMRDLGTPVFSCGLFASILSVFPDEAELCVVRLGERPVAVAILVHGCRLTEVPSASALRQFNSTNANMLMYWHLLQRAIERGQRGFDFGRSSADSNTYRFKKQWGAEPQPAAWQFFVRSGRPGDMRPEISKYAMAVKVWQKLPLGLTRLIGPSIVRGIP